MSKIKSVSQAASFINKNCDNLSEKNISDLKEWINGLNDRQTIPADRGSFRDIVRDDFTRHLKEAGIGSEAKICELGGPYNSFADLMPEYEFEFLSLFPAEGFDNVTVADATQCGYVPDEKYDAIFSISVFEHISKPWKAAEHLSRLLKPGGIVYQVAPFSYFYHGAPADYWRFTPDAFQQLFSELRPLKAEFWGGNRRRDNRGSESNPVDKDGGEEFSLDAFGGWRENWHSIFVGQKDPSYVEEKLDIAKLQAVINLVKIQLDKGKLRMTAFDQVHSLLNTLEINIDQELKKVEKGKGNFRLTRKEIVSMWKARKSHGVHPAYNRFVMAAQVGWLKD